MCIVQELSQFQHIGSDTARNWRTRIWNYCKIKTKVKIKTYENWNSMTKTIKLCPRNKMGPHIHMLYRRLQNYITIIVFSYNFLNFLWHYLTCLQFSATFEIAVLRDRPPSSHPPVTPTLLSFSFAFPFFLDSILRLVRDGAAVSAQLVSNYH